MVSEKLKPVMWECKQCHHLISDFETVAYHFIAGVLYGWCEECFAASRASSKRILAEA